MLGNSSYDQLSANTTDDDRTIISSSCPCLYYLYPWESNRHTHVTAIQCALLLRLTLFPQPRSACFVQVARDTSDVLHRMISCPLQIVSSSRQALSSVGLVLSSSAPYDDLATRDIEGGEGGGEGDTMTSVTFTNRIQPVQVNSQNTSRFR